MTQDNSLLEPDKVTWLSEAVQASIRQHYPSLVPDRGRRWLTRWGMVLLQSFIVKAFGVFIVFVVVNELCLHWGLVLVTYELDAQGASNLISGFIDYLAAMLGIVIPLVILVIEFLGRDFSAVINIYLQRTRIVRTATSALVALALHGFGMLVLSANFTSYDKFYFYACVLLLLFNLAVLIEVGLSLNKVREFLNEDFRIQAFLDCVDRAVREDLYEELRGRYITIYTRQLKESAGLVDLHTFFRVAENTKPLVAHRSGIIRDVHISWWKKLGHALATHKDERQKVTGYIIKFIGKPVTKNEPVVYVASEDQSIATLQRILNRSLQIGSGPVAKRGDILRLLRHLKQITQTTAREGNDELFIRFLDVYVHIFELGMQFLEPPVDRIFAALFPGWSVTRIITQQLADIIDTAAQSKNERIIHAVAAKLFTVVEKAISRSDLQVSASLRDVLRLFIRIYYCSKRQQNQAGTKTAYSFLTDHAIDDVWIEKFSNVYSDQRSVNNLKDILVIMLETLGDIVNAMIRNHDLEGLENLLTKLQPSELLSRFDLAVGSVLGEVWDLRQQIRGAIPELAEELGDQLQVRESALNAKAEVGDFFNDLVFISASYVVEGYDQNEIGIARTEETLAVLNPYLGTWNLSLTIEVFNRLLEAVHLAWRSFHRHPNTRQVFSPDDEAKLYLFYCLRGLQIVATEGIPGRLPSVDLRHKLPRIYTVCNQVAENTDKWATIIGTEPSNVLEFANEVRKVNQQIANQWQHDEQERVIQLDLAPEKLAVFQEAFRGAYNSAPSFRSYLERWGRVTHGAKISVQRMLGYNESRPEKKYFTLMVADSTYAEELGAQYGSALASSENALIVMEWVRKGRTLRTRKDWVSLEPYMERAFHEMRTTGYEPRLILIPYGIRHEFLQMASRFVNEQEYESSLNLPMLRGFYDDIPVVQWSNDLERRILVIDVERASQLEIEYVKADVKLLSKHTIEEILEARPELGERELQGFVNIQVQEKARVTMLDKKAVTRLPVKLPPTMWLRVEEPALK